MRCVAAAVAALVLAASLALRPAMARQGSESSADTPKPAAQATPEGKDSESGSTQTRVHKHGESLTAQAGDPTAPLVQLQLTDFHAASVRNAGGSYNLLNFQPVLPIPKSDVIPVEQVVRLTVPVLSTPHPDHARGLGDISFFDLFVPSAREWGIWGGGFTMVLPTAADDQLGSGKYQLGPAFTVVYYRKKNWQIGAVVQNPVSVAGDGDRPGVSQLQIQPIINYLRGDWYFGAGDFNIIWDWKRSEATVPLAFQVGRITKIGQQTFNFSAEVAWTAVSPDDAVIPRWGVRLGVVWMLPEGRHASH
ncbi:hypothetical protein [Dokdonella sp.]|uniref:hypothetical protein n=1 Tax=Dokdonella sp. TaxID=2291710 RepID=UPI0035276D64